MVFVAGCGFGDNSEDATSDNDNSSSETDDGDTSESAIEGDKVINLVSTADIPTLDSAHAHDGVAFTVLNNVNEGLYRSNENHIPELAIAEDHQVSDDGTVHTFTLRDAQWSNGEPVTAHDFEYSWKRIFEVVGHYNVMFETAGIKNASAIIDGEASPDELGVVAEDDKTLVVTLEGPNSLFTQLLTFPVFLPQNQAFVEEMGDEYGVEADKILFNGPFVLESWQHDQGWTYKKNPDYWDADAVNLDGINVNVVKEISTAVNLWETEAVDRITISSAYVDEYRNDESFNNEVIASIVFMRFNHNLEHFQNANIRKAIDMAIDKEGLTSTILNNGSEPLYSLVPYEFSYSPDEEKDFRELNGEFNQGSAEDAQALWEQGLSEIGSDGFEFALTVADDDNHVKSAEFIKNQLETNLPGITVEIKTVPFEARLEQEKAVEYDMVVSTWGPDYGDPMTYIDMWVTDGPANRMDYSDEEFDSLVAQAKVETDAAVRYQLMLDAEKHLLDEMHIAPLYQRADAILTRPNIKGLVRHPAAPEFEYKWVDVE
ncbi:peptide ABC transporter substrate-binding protein [Ornithinibacillus sp. L9]|uniref:Peptide ABC transporter substrate-binding protein n=2 Tax=Ornithinibacillus caprae TaxID=2678566 RepID=A0A6N8FDB7_9BACI|nr:peptide ABC transporter substrate-binding protein [Ornithinibacillus caprae]MUK87662.1 peptide ABC transporter substrate-binding protein [Ornithinibacillus caprae]